MRYRPSGFSLGFYLFLLFLLLAAPLPALAQTGNKPDVEAENIESQALKEVEIGELQLRLAQLGYYIGPINGQYSPSTARAVSNFQQANGLSSSEKVSAATWFALARRLKLASYDESSLPPVGKNLKVIIDTELLILTVMIDGKVFNQYPIAIGKYTSPSPVGEWKIANKGYVASSSAFGTRWMGLNVPWGSYGIHGTNRPWSIGWPASAGCFRMYNEDVELIYDWLPIGTPVVVKGPFTLPTGPLQPGCGAPEVIPLQVRLREKGFYVFGPADGDYGRMTELAVRQFQIYHGLEPTGVADATTLRLLNFDIPDYP
ncbi:MAG: L,D-transpeptidase family protein [Clostridia bacterium]|nr:L,D-transpeptidase family protein [Clostridia bacterium]